MKEYIGFKIINAKPMTRAEYNTLRGWEVPADEKPDDAGYLVEYTNGGNANHPGFNGYISWNPKAVFEQAYTTTNNLSFSPALEAIRLGKRVARNGWSGKAMHLQLVKPPQSASPCEPVYQVEGVNDRLLPWIGVRTAGGEFVPWLPSQADILGDDWVVIE